MRGIYVTCHSYGLVKNSTRGSLLRNNERMKSAYRAKKQIFKSGETSGPGVIQFWAMKEARIVFPFIEHEESKFKAIAVSLILHGPYIILQYISNPTRYTTFDD